MNSGIATYLSIAMLLCVGQRARAQGTFVNLDFELANVQNLPPDSPGEVVAVTNGVPGWGVFPSVPAGFMGHNAASLGGADVEIYGPQWRSDQILQGQYTVGFFHSFAGPPVSAGIFQTGRLPGDAKSIRFYGGGDVSVSFAGQQIPLFDIGSGPNYTIFGGDISAFAGQTGQLEFTGFALVDNIQLSSSAIPEPGFLRLIGPGCALLCLSWLSRRHAATVHPCTL